MLDHSYLPSISSSQYFWASFQGTSSQGGDVEDHAIIEVTFKLLGLPAGAARGFFLAAQRFQAILFQANLGLYTPA